MKEHLVRIKLKDDSTIDIHREDGDVRVCHKEHCVAFPGASGHQTLELFALLEALGEQTEFPEEEEANE